MKVETLDDLPGSELVIEGLRDLANGEFDTIEALLIGIGAPRLRSLGLRLPYSFSKNPEHDLYYKLGAEHGVNAHSKYNALIRRLVSFERALDGKLRREASSE